LMSLGLIGFHELSFVYLSHLFPQVHGPAIAGVLSFLALLGLIWRIGFQRQRASAV